MQEEHYKNKYRINSTRLNNWDYSKSGFYFITICTWRMECMFGDVVCSGEDVNSRNNSRSENTEETRHGVPLQKDNANNIFVKLSLIGKIVKEEWLRTEKKRDNVQLHNYIIMPNHFHAIIEIINVEACRGMSPSSLVSTDHIHREFSRPQKKSLSTIINQFKGAVTRQCNNLTPNPEFTWQSNFHDHIIKSEEELTKIKKYINDNPKNWEKDRNNFIYGKCIWI